MLLLYHLRNELNFVAIEIIQNYTTKFAAEFESIRKLKVEIWSYCHKYRTFFLFYEKTMKIKIKITLYLVLFQKPLIIVKQIIITEIINIVHFCMDIKHKP